MSNFNSYLYKRFPVENNISGSSVQLTETSPLKFKLTFPDVMPASAYAELKVYFSSAGQPTYGNYFTQGSVTLNRESGPGGSVYKVWMPFDNNGGVITPGFGYKSFTIKSSTISADFSGVICEYLSAYSKGTYSDYIYGNSSSYSPYLEISARANGIYISAQSPSGYVDRTQKQTFAWSLSYGNWPFENPQQTSAYIQWRVGDSGSINTINITGSAQTYTMPANTLPLSSDIQWRVTATTAHDTSETTEWIPLQTADSFPVISPLFPVDAYVDGASAITFTWDYQSSSGAPQKAYELQYSTTGESWTALRSATSAETSYSVPANTLPSGTVFWRVRCTNQSSQVSEWSPTARFFVYSAPARPTLRLDRIAPQPIISWTSYDQQAYQLQIGDYDTGLRFGTEKTFTPPFVFADGTWEVRLRTKNTWDIWSDWATTSFTAANNPGSASIELTADVDADVSLDWEPVPAALAYYVYRAGTRIGVTNDTEWIDKGLATTANYRVRALLANGNYVESNVLTLSYAPDCPMVSTPTGEWVELRYSRDQLPETSLSFQRDAEIVTYSGDIYPRVERSRHRRYSVSNSASFINTDPQIRALNSIIGEEVWYKDQTGDVFYGLLTVTGEMRNKFFTTFVYSVERLEEPNA